MLRANKRLVKTKVHVENREEDFGWNENKKKASTNNTGI